MQKAKLVKRGTKPATVTVKKRERTADEIRRDWLAEHKQTESQTAALRRKLLGR